MFIPLTLVAVFGYYAWKKGHEKCKYDSDHLNMTLDHEAKLRK